MPVKVVGVLGYAHAGKSTLAREIERNYKGTKVLRYSFARPLKEGVAAMFGFSHEQMYGDAKDHSDERYDDATPRDLLKFVGTDLIRDQLHQRLPGMPHTLWVSRFHDFVREHQDEDALVVVDDVRFADEADAIMKYDHQFFRIMRDGTKPVQIQRPLPVELLIFAAVTSVVAIFAYIKHIAGILPLIVQLLLLGKIYWDNTHPEIHPSEDVEGPTARIVDAKGKIEWIDNNESVDDLWENVREYIERFIDRG